MSSGKTKNNTDDLNESVRKKLIATGIRKLKKFGFTNVTKDNILQDEVYLFFFKRFMGDLQNQDKTLGHQIELLFRIIEQHNEDSQI